MAPLDLRKAAYVMVRRISYWEEDMLQSDQIQIAIQWGKANRRGSWKDGQFLCFIFEWRRSNP